MLVIDPGKWGGRRKGSGRYVEPTVPVRVPAKFVGEVEAFIRKAPYKLPLYVVGNAFARICHIRGLAEEAYVKSDAAVTDKKYNSFFTATGIVFNTAKETRWAARASRSGGAVRCAHERMLGPTSIRFGGLQISEWTYMMAIQRKLFNVL
jgi:hypothetical protein